MGRLPKMTADARLGTHRRVPSPIQPFPAPPLPSEALALSGSGQMAPNLLFYPVSDVPEAPARMSDREVVCLNGGVHPIQM